ncbi:MAG: molybdopterin-binding protein [Sulfolobales archaeon]|nr:molybdopterin-binding protein [Sulfolobales archaeon]MDW8083291.1 molybdopterin-binding protein [Sulfolobales archaeon]
MGEKKAWIFTLGTEVVRGLVVNTNAAFLGRRLSQLGIAVSGVITLVDDRKLIANLLRYVLRDHEPDLIVMTGGLGPTYDDITLESIAEALEKPLTINREAFEMLKEKFVSRGYELTKERLKMAYMPEGAVAISNPVGTAPGAVIRYGKTVIVCLPGVPREMEEMWVKHVENVIKEFGVLYTAEGSFTVVGVPEAVLAPILRKFYEPSGSTYIKSHPRGYELSNPIVEVYVSVTSTSIELAKSLAKEVCDKIAEEVVRLGGSIRHYGC